MRLEMAAGQLLDITEANRDPRRVAALKGGSYTVEGPLLVGASIAGAALQLKTRLQRYGEPLGLAFQLHDDLRDGDAVGVSIADIRELVARAEGALDGNMLPTEASEALVSIAEMVAAP
jgi:geranylgeranyl pyrophosphate synthase